jgi:hypothetical protein
MTKNLRNTTELKTRLILSFNLFLGSLDVPPDSFIFLNHDNGELYKGKLVNAWGLGGLSKVHSKVGAILSLIILK